ncbi:MAG TPA: hypothetical protein VMD98_07795 [Bryocella sp.]|nr:hypothetical protein [Bryocella sp.]
MELTSQRCLACAHFAVVDFVVVAGQVQHSVQNEDLQLGLGGMTQGMSVGRCNLRRNRDVTGKFADTRGERKNVGGLIFSPMSLVQLPHLFV